jgi:hypothetical protein
VEAITLLDLGRHVPEMKRISLLQDEDALQLGRAVRRKNPRKGLAALRLLADTS